MLLIKHGTIVDGTAKTPYKNDIIISGNHISAIGDFSRKKDIEVIDARGMYVTPGFIDVNTDSDHYLSLFTNPNQEDFIRQGVTSIIGGHCGASLAPLLTGSLESIRKWGDPNQINVNWHTIGELLCILELRPLGVNFGTLVGHSTIRRGIIGEDQRDLTDAELKAFKQIIKKSLSEGALGMSTGLGYAHAHLAPYREIKELLQIVKQSNGVYTTHLRNEEDALIEAVAETIAIAKETGVKTIISHLRPLKGFETQVKEARRMVNHANTIDMRFDCSPFDTSVVPMYTLLPTWAKRGNLEAMHALIENPLRQEDLRLAFKNIDPNAYTIAAAPRHEYLVGKTLKDFAETRNQKINDALIELMRLTKLHALILWKNINAKIAEEMPFDSQALVASNSASLETYSPIAQPERAKHTFTRYLELATPRNEPIEKTIQRITGVPAKTMGIEKRGFLKEGHHADIVLLLDNKPHTVIVNGKIALQNGTVKEKKSGEIIRKR